jgi:hypothetical protein
VGVWGFLSRIVTVDEWNIGVADAKLEDLVGDKQLVGPATLHPRVRWVRKPWLARYWADPCLVEHDGRLFLYYEELLFGSAKGRLRWTELAADGTLARRGSPMLSLDGHASYPYVFKHLDAFYCVPETGWSNQVTLYKANALLGPWTRHGILLDGVPARDSTVVYSGDRWWLFCTVAGVEAQSTLANLHIWHAPEPWGPWEPHRLQPAKVDLHSARPAGRPFIIDGVLYRPSQDCSPRYGTRTVINRVLTLTSEDFTEEVCSYVEPDPQGPCREGLHTVTSAAGLVVVDGYRRRPTANLFKIVMAMPDKVRGRFGRVSAGA